MNLTQVNKYIYGSSGNALSSMPPDSRADFHENFENVFKSKIL
jgi:hypothetical protein